MKESIPDLIKVYVRVMVEKLCSIQSPFALGFSILKIGISGEMLKLITH